MNAKAEADAPVEPIDWPAPVLRVSLHWDGSSWSTSDAIQVPSMTLPRSDATDPKSTAGFWIGARDAGGRLRYRVRIMDPQFGMELFEDSGEVTRLTHMAHEVDIEVLVPDRAPVTELEIISNPAYRPEGIEPYTARLSLDRERIRQPGSEAPADGHGGHHG